VSEASSARTKPAVASATSALVLDRIRRTYREGPARLEVLKEVSASVQLGEIVALVGPSGSGKTTLLQVAGLLDRADSGGVWVGGTECTHLSDAERTRTRRERIGFIYQFHHLLPEFSAIENVAMPQRIAGTAKEAAHNHAAELLGRLGLAQRLHHRPGELSGGERQRVAIARAVANGASLLLGDEPTGNLDHKTADQVFAAMLNLVRARKVAALIATHNLELAARMDRTLTIQDGVLVEP
jgi:lipoprotein-releasing system ATP-binding protein